MEAASPEHADRELGLPGLREYGPIDVQAVISAPSGSIKFNPITLKAEELSEIMARALDES